MKSYTQLTTAEKERIIRMCETLPQLTVAARMKVRYHTVKYLVTMRTLENMNKKKYPEVGCKVILMRCAETVGEYGTIIASSRMNNGR
jgi:adenylyl- and sulfurtransferase ThiI